MQMKNLRRKFLVFATIITIVLLSSGCENIFIPVNRPVVIREGVSSALQSDQQISIQSYNVLASGMVQDISNSGSNIIILNAGATNTIDLLNTDTQQLSSFINSDKKELSARYDAHDAGIYYIEKVVDPASVNVNSQLLWTDTNKNITRIISTPEENVNQFFAINQSGQVVYVNNSNELILADSEGNRTVYTPIRDYSILSVGYLEDEQGFVFMAYDPAKEEKTNLYYAQIKGGSQELSPDLVVENVLSFETNHAANQVVFIKNSGESQSIGTWKTTDTKTTTIANGNFGTASFTPDGERIFYSQYSANVDSQTQSIWIMDKNGAHPLQVTAPLHLNSKLICHPHKPVLYFSVEKNARNIDATEDTVLTQTYQLTYKID